MVKMTKQFSDLPSNGATGAFMCFDSSESDSELEDVERGGRIDDVS